MTLISRHSNTTSVIFLCSIGYQMMSSINTCYAQYRLSDDVINKHLLCTV